MSFSDDLPLVGSQVQVGSVYGVVRFAGSTRFAEGQWVGVELTKPLGKNNGSVMGVRYFQCAEKHGIFVRPKDVVVLKKERRSSRRLSGELEGDLVKEGKEGRGRSFRESGRASREEKGEEERDTAMEEARRKEAEELKKKEAKLKEKIEREELERKRLFEEERKKEDAEAREREEKEAAKSLEMEEKRVAAEEERMRREEEERIQREEAQKQKQLARQKMEEERREAKRREQQELELQKQKVEEEAKVKKERELEQEDSLAEEEEKEPMKASKKIRNTEEKSDGGVKLTPQEYQEFQNLKTNLDIVNEELEKEQNLRIKNEREWKALESNLAKAVADLKSKLEKSQKLNKDLHDALSSSHQASTKEKTEYKEAMLKAKHESEMAQLEVEAIRLEALGLQRGEGRGRTGGGRGKGLEPEQEKIIALEKLVKALYEKGREKDGSLSALRIKLGETEQVLKLLQAKQEEEKARAKDGENPAELIAELQLEVEKLRGMLEESKTYFGEMVEMEKEKARLESESDCAKKLNQYRKAIRILAQRVPKEADKVEKPLKGGDDCVKSSLPPMTRKSCVVRPAATQTQKTQEEEQGDVHALSQRILDLERKFEESQRVVQQEQKKAEAILNQFEESEHERKALASQIPGLQLENQRLKGVCERVKEGEESWKIKAEKALRKLQDEDIDLDSESDFNGSKISKEEEEEGAH